MKDAVSKMKEQSQLNVGVKEGGGPHPGYQWNVFIIDFVFEETISLVGEDGYQHLAMQIKELAFQGDPTHSDTVDVKQIETFYEIRDKGGPFGGANVRCFFGVDNSARALIPLGTIKKQNNGMTPLGDKVRMRGRWRNYLRGDYGSVTN